MTVPDNELDHANQTNPCQGICVSDGKYCLGCFRTIDERRGWYRYTNDQRNKILAELKKREQELM